MCAFPRFPWPVKGGIPAFFHTDLSAALMELAVVAKQDGARAWFDVATWPTPTVFMVGFGKNEG